MIPTTLRSRLATLIGTTAVLATLLVLVPGSPTAVAQPTSSSWCSGGAPTPCVASASLDGVAITDAHPTYDITALSVSFDGQTSLLWNVVTTGGAFDLGAGALGQSWTITFDVGSLEPRVAFTRGLPGAVVRTAGPNTISITSSPVTVTGECDLSIWPWTCPHTASVEWVAALGGQVTDYGAWSDVAQREAMYGYDVFTNVDGTSIPAEILPDRATGEQRLAIRMANSHFRTDGVTPVSGFMYQRIPNAFLRLTYAIDNPATLTARGLDPTLGGAGSGTVSITDVGPALVVDAQDMSFSRRVLRVGLGVITPRKPTALAADRTGVARAKVTFDAGTARGSKVIRHQARCREINGDDQVRKRVRSDRRIVVRGLEADRPYWCRVRAISKAGPGKWSKRVRVTARP